MGMQRYQMYIDGRYVDASSGQFFVSENPYTGEPWAEMPRGNQADVESAVQAAHKAYTQSDWASFTPTQRGALLRKLGDLVARDRSEEHTSELQSLMRISYAVFCLKKKKKKQHNSNNTT